MIKINNHIIDRRANIRDAVRRIDQGGLGFGIVVDEKKNVVGIITDGDFRRAVLRGVNLDENVMNVTNEHFTWISSSATQKEAFSLMHRKNVEFLPVLRNRKLVSILTNRDRMSSEDCTPAPVKKMNAPVVIMAGGKGTRMEPFTKILPKPLIPIGDKSMLEIIMGEYAKYGMTSFYLSVFHKANMIKSYFEYHQTDYRIRYINEDKPLGTAGALTYLMKKVTSPFFVSNCDIIIKDDYQKIFEFHKSGKFALTMVTSMQMVKIPYGVCELDTNGGLKKINEKPEFDYLINTGMYVLDPKALRIIPQDCHYDITDLIEELLRRKMSVGVYPVSEQSYIDVGQWTEYKKAINILSL